MPVAVDATVGGASANSYVTLAEASTYFEGRLNVTGWTGAASDDIRNRALVQAAKRIDQEEFRGAPINGMTGTVSPGQAMKWPRAGAVDPEGWGYLQTIIPTCIKEAQMEVALDLLNKGATDPFADTGLEGFESVKVGPLEVVPKHSRKAGDLPEHVRRMLAHVITTARNSGRIVRS
jgi:hypothetical protein